ncbi:MAG: plasmid recombination protein [Acidipropionibacterium acidipropionici]|jgi:hypothetical protein|uniref:plasmid recombination protein n=1 Tax=Acidipropionibacterium acidipropionici TaxID=1748 RepID=UPI002F360FDC
MSYTATFDASHKVKASGAHATNLVRHIARDADQAVGFSFAQRNPNIDPARTSMNITMVNDGNGGWRVPVVTQDEKGNDRPPSAELTDYLDARLATVEKKIKADAVAMRPLVLQLDPKWFAEHNPDWREDGLNAEAEQYIGAQLDWAAQEFRQQNLPGYSVHMDETNPQLQLLFTPVTEDGRLSQKDFFKGPGDLQRQHKEHRRALADAGYDVEFKVNSRSKEHLSSAEYAASARRLQAGGANLARDQDDLNARAVKVRVRESDVSAAERDLVRRQARAEQEGRRSGFERGYEEGRVAGEESARADLIALDLLPADDSTPVLPRRRAPKPPPEKLTPARERYLSYTRQQSK